MRPSITCICEPPDYIKSIWVINYWVIDADTPIMAITPAIVVEGDIATVPNIHDLPTDSHTDGMEPEAAIDAADKYL